MKLTRRRHNGPPLHRRIPLSLLLFLLSSAATVYLAAPTEANKPPSNFRVVLDSPRGNHKMTRLMLKNSLSAKSEDVQAMIEKAKEEFHHISTKTKEIVTKFEGEAREFVDKLKENLQHYTKLELGFYAALTVALTFTVKSMYQLWFSACGTAFFAANLLIVRHIFL
jgi:gas vesicle protein